MLGLRRQRTVFFGSDAVALPLLQGLYEGRVAGIELVGLVSGPDRRRGRGKSRQANPVTEWARENDLPLLQPEKPDTATINWLGEQQTTLVLVMAYGHLLRKSLLDFPLLGAWNFHGSLLPAYRGASPIETALAQGDAVTGVSLMRMVPAMDAGPVCAQQEFAIEMEDTGPLLRQKLARATLQLAIDALPVVAAGQAVARPQSSRGVSYVRKLSTADRALDFNASAFELARRIRAFSGWPGSVFPYGDNLIRVDQPSVTDSTDGQFPGSATPGSVLGVGSEGLQVATGEGVLNLGALQRPGGKLLKASAFLRGFPIEAGECLISVPMPQLVRGKE